MSIAHFLLDELQIIHCMDLNTGSSADLSVEKANVIDAIHTLQATSISVFWFPEKTQREKAFASGTFLVNLKARGILFSRVPPE